MPTFERMNTSRLLSVFASCLLAAASLGEASKDYPKVDDTSSTEPNGDRVIRLSVDVNAAPEEVWKAFTTSEGWKSFAVAVAAMDMRVGGVLETSYRPDARIGDPGNIKNEVVAYIPGRMLAVRCVQTPPDFPHKEEFMRTATVLEVLPAGAGKTRVVATSVGYRPGEAYDDLYKHFRWGNAYTLEKLRLKFEPASTDKPAASAAGTAVK